MSNQEAFRILGLSGNADKQAIKRAYASLVKQYHPEEFPNEWNQIHDAYETALKYVKIKQNSSQQHNIDDYIQEYVQQEIERLEQEERRKEKQLEKERQWQEEYESLFNQETWQWEKEKLRYLTKRMNQMIANRTLGYKDFQKLFESPEFQEFRLNPVAIDMLRGMLGRKRVGRRTKTLVKQTVKQINSEIENPKLHESCQAVLEELQLQEKKYNKFWGVLAIIVIVVLFFWNSIPEEKEPNPDLASEILDQLKEQQTEDPWENYYDNLNEQYNTINNFMESTNLIPIEDYMEDALKIANGIYFQQEERGLQIESPELLFSSELSELKSSDIQEMGIGEYIALCFRNTSEITADQVIWQLNRNAFPQLPEQVNYYYVYDSDGQWLRREVRGEEERETENLYAGSLFMSEQGAEKDGNLYLTAPVSHESPIICVIPLETEQQEME